jgi:hypothetical protein
MTINYCQAVASRYLETNNKLDSGIRERIESVLRRVDALLPGCIEAFSASGLNMVYDPRNVHGMFWDDMTSQTAYYWPLNRLYLGDAGIQKGIVHDSWHVLDLLAGSVDNNYQTINTFTLSMLYPRNRFVADTTRGSSGELIVNVIHGARISRTMGLSLSAVKKRFCEGIEKGYDQETGWSLGDFLSERFAHLFEEIYYLSELSRGARVPEGVGDQAYFDLEIFWEPEWIQINQERIDDFYKKVIALVADRINNGDLQRRVDLMREEGTDGGRL